MRSQGSSEQSSLGTSVVFLAATQWFVFILASVITVPIVLGPALGLSVQGTAALTERTLFVSGLLGMAQAWWGHRVPIVEGPAGMWWGVFLVLIQMTRDTGESLSQLRPELEFGLILAGIFYVLLALFNWVDPVRRLFTPAVTGVFMTLLSLQLAATLLRGILGMGSAAGALIHPRSALVSLALVVLTVFLMNKGRGMVRNFAVLIALTIGWAAFALLGWGRLPATAHLVLAVPQVFPFGIPRLQWGVAITALFTAVVLLSNLISSVYAMGHATEVQAQPNQFRRATLISGLGTALAGVFGVVGNVPLATSASFVQLSKISARLPFLLANGLLVVIACVPVVGNLLATLPESVGYAVLFVVFGQLLGLGLKDFQSMPLNQRDLYVISMSIMSGVGIFFVPSTAWVDLPPLIGYLLGNGLLVGVLLVLLLEHLVFRHKPVATAHAGCIKGERGA
ncbi:permease [Alicyclobacillaceae bacterium I2511]|nr:permease [Alicyclobacillaceae bacterium I2511]